MTVERIVNRRILSTASKLHVIDPEIRKLQLVKLLSTAKNQTHMYALLKAERRVLQSISRTNACEFERSYQYEQHMERCCDLQRGSVRTIRRIANLRLRYGKLIAEAIRAEDTDEDSKKLLHRLVKLLCSSEQLSATDEIALDRLQAWLEKFCCAS